jgi:hypothetical protein
MLSYSKIDELISYKKLNIALPMKVFRNLKLFSTNSNFYPMANRRTPKPLKYI